MTVWAWLIAATVCLMVAALLALWHLARVRGHSMGWVGNQRQIDWALIKQGGKKMRELLKKLRGLG